MQSATKVRPGTVTDQLKAISPKVGETFSTFRQAIRDSGPIDPKTRELIMLAVLSSGRIEAGFRNHCRSALKAGATREEINQAILLTLGSTDGLSAVVGALHWAEEVMAENG